MAYDFDRVVNRYNTDSLKYDFAVKRGKPADILPLWVADMDFPAPKEVVDVLVDKSLHGVYGYSEGREDYDLVIKNWFQSRFDWAVESDWLVKTPGVVFAVATAINAYTKEGEAVLIQEPVYYPFRESVEVTNRQLVVNELVYESGRYHIDFDLFEQQIIDSQVKLFILCSPHNPVGRVWTKEELIKLGDICVKHNVLVVSDEIHADFVYQGHTHHVFANIKEAYRDISITCTAPSKSFNLAALQLSNVFISQEALRNTFVEYVTRAGYSQPNIMGLISCKAAYEHGVPWLEELKVYLAGNLEYFKEYLKKYIPEAILVEPEGTYLVWVDVRRIPAFVGKTDDEINDFMVNNAKLWLDGGTMFGDGGSGFQRFNIACPRATLEKALSQLKEAIS